MEKTYSGVDYDPEIYEQAKQFKNKLSLEDMPLDLLIKMGKAQYLCVALIEAAERDIPGLPKAVALDAKTLNQQAIAAICASIEERRGEAERDAYLKEITSILPKRRSRKHTPKQAVKNSPALKRKRNESKKA
jgi:hypothetical protein